MKPKKPKKVIIIELLDRGSTIDQAMKSLASMRLSGGDVFGIEDGTFFSAFTFPPNGDVDDCKVITVGGQPKAYLHGTDCVLSRLVADDLRRGTTSPFKNCERSAAGGSFDTIDVLALNLN